MAPRHTRAPRLQLRRALSPAYLALAAILALSAVLNTVKLSQNAWGNVFYSASVKSMLGSLHNFLFASFDQGALVTIDKPPLGVWVQVASAKLFGFAPLSLLIPEAVIGTLTVALLYAVLARRLGVLAALAGALALAVFPVFVAVSRDNGVDPLLIALMLLACAAALRSVEHGRLRWLLVAAALIGLAFNTKTLAAYLAVPGIALGWLVCAPVALPRRLLSLLAAGAVLAGVSFAWIAIVELTPTAQRPYVGSSTDNTELGLTFEYNGFGRVEGEVGGPGNVPTRAGGVVPPTPRPPAAGTSAARAAAARTAAARAGPKAQTTGTNAGAHALGRAVVTSGAPRTRPAPAKPAKYLPDGRYRYPIAFGGSVGALRLFDNELSGQGAWTLPLAVFGLIALALQTLLPSRPRRFAGASANRDVCGAAPGTTASLAGASPDREPLSVAAHDPGSVSSDGASAARTQPVGIRRDPRLAVLLVLGGWFVVELVVLSFSKGIVHPYYISALAPGAAAMIGAGIGAFVDFARRRDPRLLLLVLGVAGSVAAQIAIIEDQAYLQWWIPFLIAGSALAVAALLVRRLAVPAVAVALGVLLVAPTAYATTTWLAPVEGTFPAAGPHEAPAAGAYDASPKELREDRNLIRYARAHRPGSRWSLLADSSPTAAPIILLGSPAGALGGYGGSDPVLDGSSLARLIARGQARYVAIGGEYASRGGNAATAAVIHDCPQVPHEAWHGPIPGPDVLVLFDCAGRESALQAHPHG